ncbi:hypothetical protein Tco_0522174 [Tanacetum coccineum]
MYHDLYLGGKALVEREDVGLDLTKSDLFPSFIEDLTMKGMGLRVVDSHTGNYQKDDFTPLETIRRFLEMDFRSFMMERIDGEFNFLPEGYLNDEGSSPSSKSVNNEAPAIDAEPITDVPPLRFTKNIGNSDDAPPKKDEVALIGHSVPNEQQNPQVGTSSKADGKRKQVVESSREGPCRKTRKVTPQESKAYFDASNPLDEDSDPDIHGESYVDAHVTPPSWKQHLKEISLEKLCDVHDNAYMRQYVLDNMLNSRTCKLMSTLSKARASYDAIRERDVEKDKGYVELDRKCNEALQDLEKNPLVLDMRSEIETLQVKGLESERERLKISEIQLLQEINGLRQDRVVVVSKVVPHPLPLYPFISKVTANPYASLEKLFSKKPKSLRTKPTPSNSKPLSSRAVGVILTIRVSDTGIALTRSAVSGSEVIALAEHSRAEVVSKRDLLY